MNEKRKRVWNIFTPAPIYWTEGGWDMNRETQQAVWQRVLSPGEGAPEDTAALLAEAGHLYRCIRALAGRPGPMVRAMTENQRQTVEALRGICRLQGTVAPAPSGPLPVQTPGLAAECYRRSHRAMTDYAARAAQPLTGTVFSDLADLQKQNCTLLARLLGRMDS